MHKEVQSASKVIRGIIKFSGAAYALLPTQESKWRGTESKGSLIFTISRTDTSSFSPTARLTDSTGRIDSAGSRGDTEHGKCHENTHKVDSQRNFHGHPQYLWYFPPPPRYSHSCHSHTESIRHTLTSILSLEGELRHDKPTLVS